MSTTSHLEQWKVKAKEGMSGMRLQVAGMECGLVFA